MSTRATVERFWGLMASNDFHSVAEVLADDFVLKWPQSHWPEPYPAPDHRRHLVEPMEDGGPLSPGS